MADLFNFVLRNLGTFFRPLIPTGGTPVIMSLTPKTPEQIYKSWDDFKKWKEDLERRAEDHLQKHPESPSKIPPPTTAALVRHEKRKYYTMPASNLVVQVTESEVQRGRWCVWVNDRLDKMYTGPLAQSYAIKYANAILNPKDEAVGNPCLFCGRRSGHREGCPEADETA